MSDDIPIYKAEINDLSRDYFFIRSTTASKPPPRRTMVVKSGPGGGGGGWFGCPPCCPPGPRKPPTRPFNPPIAPPIRFGMRGKEPISAAISTKEEDICGFTGFLIFAFPYRMTPETRELILQDYKAGKAKSAAQLGKLYNVSRSAVYRVLKSFKESSPSVADAEDKDEESQTRIVDNDDLVSRDMLEKMNLFADDLGLPMEGSHLRHDVEEKTPAQREADEQELDRLIGRIAGDFDGSAGDAMDSIISKLYEEPAPPPRVQPTQRVVYEPPAPQVDKVDITQRIIFNVEHFAPHLKTITGDNKEVFIQSLGSRSGAELKGLLTTIERTRSVGNLAAGFKQMFFVASQAVETGTRAIGMKTHGFTEQLQEQDEEITMCLKEIAINEWERLKAFDSPQIRLGSLFCMTLIQTDARNRMNDQLRKVVSAPVNPSVAAANEDL